MVPQGIESVNGSPVNMGCTSPLVDSDGVMVCNMSQSYLVDGCSPAIDTSTSDWASQLVTVRKTQTNEIQFDHVLLTFGFDPAVTLTGIELDLFLCPELNTYAPFFSVYGNTENNFDLTFPVTSLPFENYPPMDELDNDVIPHSCDSLSTVTIPFGDALLADSFHTWHIVVSNFNSSIDWVRVGEVRFLGTDVFDPGMMLLVILSLLSLRVSMLVFCVFTKQYRHMQGHVLQNQILSLPPSQVSLFHYQQPITL